MDTVGDMVLCNKNFLIGHIEACSTFMRVLERHWTVRGYQQQTVKLHGWSPRTSTVY